MNDKDRDRSGDGAGPVAQQQNNIQATARLSIRKIGSVFVFLCLLFVTPAISYGNNSGNDRLRGLSLTVDFGLFKASSATADFYNGNPNNVFFTVKLTVTASGTTSRNRTLSAVLCLATIR